ncbi:MAG: hypothetical protein WAQ99_07595 [Pyrinomonadaceae bacterium]
MFPFKLDACLFFDEGELPLGLDADLFFLVRHLGRSFDLIGKLRRVLGNQFIKALGLRHRRESVP